MALASSLDADGLAALAAKQCANLIPDGTPGATESLRAIVPAALSRLEHCFQAIDNKYFFDGKRVVFSHLHGDQYAMWLYFLANELYRQGGPVETCARLFLLNKALHGCDVYYEVALPEIFLLVHPVGTVLGRGDYSDYFVAYQRCSVGSNHDIYPRFGRHVTMRPGSAVLGDCTIGDKCQIATESLVLDRDVPSNTVYIGNPKTAILRPQGETYPLWRTELSCA